MENLKIKQKTEDMIKPPWTAEQVKNLEDRQECGDFHPYTCRQCSENRENTNLMPMPDGWYCPRCDMMVQDWAHSTDVSGRFRALANFPRGNTEP